MIGARRESENGRRRRELRGCPRAMAALACACGLSACALLPPALRNRGDDLAVSLAQLLPHADRDHFVYVFSRVDNGRPVGDGIQVEHVSALDTPGEFQVLLSENGVGIGRVRIRDTGTALLLLAEDDLVRGVRMAYDPPLPYVEVPLPRRARQTSTNAAVSRLSDGKPLGSLRVTQVEEAQIGPPFRSRLGSFPHTVVLRVERTLHDPEGSVTLNTTMMLVPDLGEVRSDGTIAGAPSLHRQLACAVLEGHRIGDCKDLKAQWEELDAGSADHR